MKKILLALGFVILLSAFTNNSNEPIVLTDIEGTLLQSYPIIENLDQAHTITFTVNAGTIVTSTVENGITHINLIENGTVNNTVQHKITFETENIDFNNYFDSNYDVASGDDDDDKPKDGQGTAYKRITKGKPKRLMM